MTFTTFATSQHTIDVQIRFCTEDDTPGKALIYHWKEARTTGRQVADDYARFIKSQLRLDYSRVIEQTNALTAVAGWRIKRGESLAEALKYASYRLKLDSTLINALPVRYV